MVGQPEVGEKRASRKPADDLLEADFWPACAEPRREARITSGLARHLATIHGNDANRLRSPAMFVSRSGASPCCGPSVCSGWKYNFATSYEGADPTTETAMAGVLHRYTLYSRHRFPGLFLVHGTRSSGSLLRL